MILSSVYMPQGGSPQRSKGLESKGLVLIEREENTPFRWPKNAKIAPKWGLEPELSPGVRTRTHCVNTLMILHAHTLTHDVRWLTPPRGGAGARFSSAPRRTLTEARALLDRPLNLDRDPPLQRQREQLAVVGGERRLRPRVVLARSMSMPRSAPAPARPGSASPPARGRLSLSL